jgi:hypothetical protein
MINLFLMRFMLKDFFLFMLAVFAASCVHGSESTMTSASVVGAIRWDAWHGEKSDVGRAVLKTLTPNQWQWRLPFFAKVASDGTVHINGDTSETMDREVTYAKAAGLDYWAFVAYDTSSPMSLGLHRYLASPRCNEIHFCMISEASRWTPQNVANQAGRFATLMALPNYQTVIGKRPLFYILNQETETNEKVWVGAGGFGVVVDSLRAAARVRGLGDPYFVAMVPQPEAAQRFAASSGCDAISAYAVQNGGKGAPYAELAAWVEQFWSSCQATGAKVVPLVMTGWDRRPRVENPVFWESNDGWNAEIGRYYQAPRPAELTAHIGCALAWIHAHPQTAEAQTVIVYGWNEHDEGGWLCPTLGEGDERIKAVARALLPE